MTIVDTDRAPDVQLVWPKLPPDPRRAHWSKVYRAKRQWADDVWDQLADQLALRLRATGPGKRVVLVTFERPGPLSDTDNAYALAKVPLDVLTQPSGRRGVGLGLLWDDDPANCDLRVATISTRPTRTVLRLWL